MLSSLYEESKSWISLATKCDRIKESTLIGGERATLLLDGFETKLNKSNQDQIETITYSSKKRMHSLNTLVAMSPSTRTIRWISFPEGGSNNDKMILKNEVNTLFQKLDDDECVLADEGFCGNEEYRIYTINNATTNENLRKEFNSRRCRVENGISEIRDWGVTMGLIRDHVCDEKKFNQTKRLFYMKLSSVALIINMRKFFQRKQFEV